jgi:hypothetical protein
MPFLSLMLLSSPLFRHKRMFSQWGKTWLLLEHKPRNSKPQLQAIEWFGSNAFVDSYAIEEESAVESVKE